MADNSNIVNLFIPCQMDMFQAGTAQSAFTVLERLGLLCQYHEEQTCCGRCFHMQGENEYVTNLAFKIVDENDAKLPFVIPDCACAGFIRKYYQNLLWNVCPLNNVKDFVLHVYELCDYIVNIKHIEKLNNTFNHRVFYFKSCAARNLYPTNDAPEILLRNTNGLSLLTDDSIAGCCGANGRFAMENPELAAKMTGDILSKIYALGAEYVTSTDIHCLQQMDAYKMQNDIGIEVIHIADILKGEE